MSKYKNEMKNKKEAGITLIALTITVIVMLILAGITIAAISGDNGILQNAGKAKEKTELATLEEKIKLLTVEAMINQTTGESEEKTAQELQKELNEQGENVLVVQWNKYIIFDLDENKEYRVAGNGDVTYYGESIMGNTLKNAIVPNSEQKESRNEGYIGVGTDGNTVNLDLWEYAIDNGVDNSKGYGLNDEIWLKTGASEVRTCGYIAGENEENIVNGKIKGCVPMFIKDIEDNYWIAITSMSATFYNINGLIIPPEIPNTVINLREAFLSCKNLISMPEIPCDITDMRSTFNSCSKLINIKDIPNKVTDMSSTFNSCTSLEKFGNIPDSVTKLNNTFYHCINLLTIGSIGKNVINMTNTFSGCTSLEVMPNIPKQVQNLQATFVNCSMLTGVNIVIPNTVTNLTSTFNGCIKMSGKITINANPTEYKYCFGNCATNGDGLKIDGSSNILSEMKESYSSNKNLIFI